MKKDKEIKISYWAAHATTIVSVTFVLLIAGIIGMVTVAGAKESQRLRESLEVSVIMADSVSDAGASALAQTLASKPYCRDVQTISKAQAMEAWKRDTGEDLEALFGVNILSPEITFNLPAAYAVPDSVKKIEAQLAALPGVEAVASPESGLVQSMHSNITRLSLVLGAIGLVLVVISFVLINNTVHLTVYARRFLIHTMQLVGATDGFIRRPFVVHNLLAGALAGVIASGILAVALGVAPSLGYADIAALVPWGEFALMASVITMFGALLCGAAAMIATTRYLFKDYHQLFLL